MTAVETLAAKLNQLGVSTPEQAVIGKILATLPRDYHVVSKCFESMTKDEKTLENLRSKLAEEEKILKRQSEEDKLKMNAPTKVDDALFTHGPQDNFSHGRGNPRKRGRGGKYRPYPPNSDGERSNFKTLRCDYCGGRFHTEDTCRHKARDEKAAQEKLSSSKANLANSTT